MSADAKMLDRVAWVLSGGPSDLEGMTRRAAVAIKVLGALAREPQNERGDRFEISEVSALGWGWTRLCEAGEHRSTNANFFDSPQEAQAAAVRAGGLIPGIHRVDVIPLAEKAEAPA